MTRVGAALALGVFAFTLAACGGGGKAVPSDAATLMRAQIANARAAAAEGHYSDAVSSIQQVERVVADLRARHAITSGRADEIQAAAAALAAALTRYVPTSTTTTVPVTAPPSAQPAAGHDRKRPKGHDNGRQGD